MHVRVLHRIGRSQRTGPRPRPGWPLALAALALVALVALVAAGCGSSNNNSGGSNSGGGGGGGGYGGGGAPTTGAATTATVSTSNTKLGQILVDGSGRTLYLFQKDQPNQSACSGACASAWPVDQSAGTPKATSGVKASMLGTIKRSDGTTQVTYNKHPLYYYSGDTGAGQQNGQGLNAFGALWYVVGPAGNQVT
jgi:predicted lipoprotein with Yx(FWY)xxD motif